MKYKIMDQTFYSYTTTLVFYMIKASDGFNDFSESQDEVIVSPLTHNTNSEWPTIVT